MGTVLHFHIRSYLALIFYNSSPKLRGGAHRTEGSVNLGTMADPLRSFADSFGDSFVKLKLQSSQPTLTYRVGPLTSGDI